MTSNHPSQEPSVEVLQSDSARQRWEWFHRAIALAKQSNSDALREADEPLQGSPTDGPVRGDDPQLSIAR